jgi:hypothetical protein
VCGVNEPQQTRTSRPLNCVNVLSLCSQFRTFLSFSHLEMKLRSSWEVVLYSFVLQSDGAHCQMAMSIL